MSSLPPPDDDLRAFYQAEKDASLPIDAEQTAAMLQRLKQVADIAAPVAATSALAGSAVVSLKAAIVTTTVAATVALGVGGLAGHWATKYFEQPASTAPQSSPTEGSPTEIEALEAPQRQNVPQEHAASPSIDDDRAQVPRASNATDPHQPGTPTVATAREQPANMRAPDQDLPRRSSLSRERRLLDSARAAFGRRNWSEAEHTLSRHARLYPEGTLAEDRDALLVRVLFASEQFADAETKARAFLSRYPTSLHAARIAQLRRSAREPNHRTAPTP